MTQRFLMIGIMVCAFAVGEVNEIFAREDLGLLSPSKDTPQDVVPGGVLKAEVALPIALTPPPGVQKSSVWTQWKVVLKRRIDISHETKVRFLSYELRLLKVRPCPKNVNYIFEGEVLNWLPSGTYDLHVVGPGISYQSKQAVIVKGDNHPQRNDSLVNVQYLGRKGWLLENTSTRSEVYKWDMILGQKVEAADLLVNGKPAKLAFACWAKIVATKPSGKSRFLTYMLKVPPGKIRLELKARKKRLQKVSIIPSSAAVRPLEWTVLRAKSSFSPVSIIWKLADGETAIGAKIEYRWMVTTKAVAHVFVFDKHGSVYNASLKIPLRMPLERTGLVSCGMSPCQMGRTGLIDFLLKNWFEAFFILLE